MSCSCWLSAGCYLSGSENWGVGIAEWLERQTRDWKVAGLNPCRSGWRLFFSMVDFLCWLLFRYPFHPSVTAIACKRSRSFCQKCRWQVTAKHAYTLCMWLFMKWHGAWLYGVHRTCTEMAAVSCGTSHASAVSTPLRWIFKKRAIKKLFTHVESHASAVNLLNSGEQRYIKAINNNYIHHGYKYQHQEEKKPPPHNMIPMTSHNVTHHRWTWINDSPLRNEHRNAGCCLSQHAASLRFKAWKAGLVYNCRETSRVWLTGCLCVVITVIALVGRVLLAGQSLLTLKLTGAWRPVCSWRWAVGGDWSRGRDAYIRLLPRRADMRGDDEGWALL